LAGRADLQQHPIRLDAGLGDVHAQRERDDPERYFSRPTRPQEVVPFQFNDFRASVMQLSV
jgi:hypothetical protein